MREKLAYHIQRRGSTWYVFLDVPKDAREKLKRRIFRQTLKTDSRSQAIRAAPLWIAQWKAEIAKARDQSTSSDADYFRDALRRADTPEKRQIVLSEIELAAWEIGAANVEQGQTPSRDPEARRFYATATGALAATLDLKDEWVKTLHDTPKTIDMKTADVERLAAKFKFLRDIERPAVKRWVTALTNEEGLTPKTVQRILSALRGYWRYLKSVHAVPEQSDPFHGLDIARDAKREERRKQRLPFAPEDVVKLWRAADAELADVIEAAMWSGARIEELCSLGVEKVNLREWWFDVEDAKTPAGWRRVPIHAKARPLFKRLIGRRTHGFLFASLTANKYGDRSNAVGKRFGYLKTRFGFGRQFVFHSIRRTVATALENAGVPENVAADIIGHEKPTMTYGLYSGGASLKVKREALARLRYPGIT